MTVKQFLLKKFPTKDYFDCPISKEHWETIQEFADQEVATVKRDLEKRNAYCNHLEENWTCQKSVDRIKEKRFGGAWIVYNRSNSSSTRNETENKISLYH